jgi:putative transposase
MLRSYKYRIYPTAKQEQTLAKVFGCVRFVWNKNVEVFNSYDKENNPNPEFKSSTEYRQEFNFLQEISAATIQQKEIDFREYKKQYFSKGRKKKFGRPQFKSRRNKQSFRLPNQKFKLLDNKIQLEKIGKIRIVIDRHYYGKPMSVTVSKDSCGDYYASILVEEEIKQKEKTNRSVGIDVGLKSLVTTSDGLQILNFPDNQRKIKHIQRHLSRKKKGSNRFNDMKLRLAKLHRKESRKREWLLHNISTFLVDNYDIIVAEDLNVSGMMKNHKLAGSICRSSWSELFKMIDYKCKFYGKEFIQIDRFFPSSKTCNRCGCLKSELKLSDRVFVCDDCDYEIDRDLNASKNIKSVGVATAKQSVMECKTWLGKPKQAIPNDLMRVL